MNEISSNYSKSFIIKDDDCREEKKTFFYVLFLFESNVRFRSLIN